MRFNEKELALFAASFEPDKEGLLEKKGATIGQGMCKKTAGRGIYRKCETYAYVCFAGMVLQAYHFVSRFSKPFFASTRPRLQGALVSVEGKSPILLQSG